VLETGDASALEQRVLAVHRLKTAAPAAALARMGAIAGGGSDVQQEALGRYFEAVGLAFQIVDDVLNLRGFKGELKQTGEDISQGKVTLPVAKALGRLEPEQRKALWAAIASKPQDAETVRRVIAQIEACGALEDCSKQAKQLVEDAWRALDPLVEASVPKIMLRAFGWYVLERHY
jgi:geranylgeranyl pyrophosphate synthase